jgi:hypothetical protein
VAVSCRGACGVAVSCRGVHVRVSIEPSSVWEDASGRALTVSQHQPHHAQVFAESVFEHMLQTHGTEVEANRHLNVLAHSLKVTPTLALAPVAPTMAPFSLWVSIV